MKKIVPKKKRRNDGQSEVYGISASKEFWDEVRQRMEETGQGRSEIIVEACSRSWRNKALLSRPVGRPVRKGKS